MKKTCEEAVILTEAKVSTTMNPKSANLIFLLIQN